MGKRDTPDHLPVPTSVNLWPLQPWSIVDLVKAGVLTLPGVNEVAFKVAVEAQMERMFP